MSRTPTQVKITLNPKPKEKPDPGRLGFGQHFTDHMFLMDYAEGKGWHDPRIVPYAPLELDPSAMVFHYGQAVFEGLKAYRREDGRVFLFRPELNTARLGRSSERMEIPPFDESLLLEALQLLVGVDFDWVPELPGQSLYIRPLIIATEAALGVRASSRYLMVIILSPAASYYGEGLKPIRIQVQTGYTRAASGGTGNVKASANYAGGMRAQAEARAEGCLQVLWLDAVERQYIEEVGSMNVFFRIGDEICTPALSGTILDGVTRRSVMELLELWGMQVVERRISIHELEQAAERGELLEAFGTGTAAVISPIGHLHFEDREIKVGSGCTGELTTRLYNALTDIQYGRAQQSLGWSVEVERSLHKTTR